MEAEDQKYGQVLRIERTSLHDGDGLRTVVFMKGCPLRCLWCSTPESQKQQKELGLRLYRCVSCGRCAKECPEGALQFLQGKLIKDKKRCNHCFACERVCPNAAWQIYGNNMSIEELMDEISKDEIFYFHSGGGVTFSGGEPLLQPEYVSTAMKKCHERGIQTAMESSLYAEWDRIELVLPHLDILFADIKVMDRESHIQAAGADNTIILDNLKRISAGGYPVSLYIRIPIIPGINNNEENLKSAVQFCDTLNNVKEIELLPYHRLGVDTYKSLNMDYKLKELQTPKPDEMKELAALMNTYSKGTKVRTGGGFTK